MRLERALFTGSASPALPATQVVNPGAIFNGPVRRKSGIGKGGVPGRSTEALVDEVSCSLGRCCDDWQHADAPIRTSQFQAEQVAALDPLSSDAGKKVWRGKKK